MTKRAKSTPSSPRSRELALDFEPEDLEAPVEALVGGPPSGGDPSEIAAYLLDLTGALARLHVLLDECDEDEWRAVQGRLGLFRRLAEQLPTAPRPKRRLGFQVNTPRPKRQDKAAEQVTAPKRTKAKR